jgi:serine phosphatase RsbU (regulator of sigma subunit)
VQLGFLPTRRPELPGYEFHDHYEAALSVGGDFFDYVSLPHGLQAVVLGDVAGKGVAAALLMARMHSAIRYQLLLEADPAKAVTALNATVASSGLGFRFVTFVLLVIDPRRHTAALVNAGHLPPLLRSGTGDVQKLGLNISGLPLGVMPDTQYRSVTVPIAPHDLILLYTDGVTEAMNPQNELFGLQRVIELLRHSQGRVDEIDEKLLDEVEKFAGGRDQSDDICLVAVQRTSAAG